MTTPQEPAPPPTQDEIDHADAVRRICGPTLYAGDWPREAMVAAIGLTCAMDIAEKKGDDAARVTNGIQLLALARIHVPHIADQIEPPLAAAA